MAVSTERYHTRQGRMYRTPAGEFPSVTTILGVIAKPALVPWAANMERRAVMEAAWLLYEELRDVKPMSKTVYMGALDGVVGKEKAHARKMAQAAEIGSQAHNYIEWLLLGELGRRRNPIEPALTDGSALAVEAFKEWRVVNQMEPLAIEDVVYSATYKFAGTRDLLARVNGRRAIVDFKTSGRIYKEAYLQVAAYDGAATEMGEEPAEVGIILRLPKVAEDNPFEAATLTDLPRLFKVFRAARYLWDYIQGVSE